MQQGYRKPLTEKDVWKLDTWDQTETLNRRFKLCCFYSSFFCMKSYLLIFSNKYNSFNFCRFQACWVEESQRSKPLLLRALNHALGGRYRLTMFFLSFFSFLCISVSVNFQQRLLVYLNMPWCIPSHFMFF